MKKLVFDVGGSAIKYALMEDDATIIEKGKEATPQDTLEHFLDIIKSIYEKYKDQIDGLAFSLPGTIDSNKGQIYAPGSLVYNANVNLVDKIHEFCDLPVALENDGKSAALAESWKGNLKDCQNGIVLVIGTGIGGGIILNKKLWKGNHLFAGEFSYIFQGEGTSFMENAFAMKASTTALIFEVARRKNIEFTELNGIKIFEMIDQKDEDACAALQVVAKNLATGIYNLQCILDPEKVLIGGGISQQPILLEKIKEELDKLYAGLPFEIPHANVDVCEFHNDSNLIGALYNYHLLYQGE